ncbi:hypothetical protein GCM10011514_52140 [Emticicia aquatilis]|uniref:DUF5723 domain-containing protein n=1 Tax=Emticicia aquatilis TaxID=1537369 RepID=A0A916Z8M2_9BACT|nr:hypothetical protein [Emticicia aquatilis]GGD81616.1 hypothetical protein GCM10011514_52140 [Emticicia aquatilis]
MKKLLIFIFFPLFSFAQTDSVKVSFSEEKVDTFARTEVISVSQKLGVMRAAKAGLRGGIESSPFVIQNYISFLNFTYEQKILKEFSLLLSLKHSVEYQPFSYEIEPRWYFQMTKRVKAGLQAYNLYGKYISFRYYHGILKDEPYYFFSYNPYSETSVFAIKYGYQAGNILDLSVSAGVKNVSEVSTDTKGRLIHNSQSPSNQTWFLASNLKLSFGNSYPKTKTDKFGKLLITDNNFEKNKLLKINASDLFSIDKYSQFIKADVDYEHRIGNTYFSSNTSFTGIFNHFKFFSFKGFIDTTLNSNLFGKKFPIWNAQKVSNVYTNIQLSEQLRYYFTKGKEVKKGRSGKNFNGVYLGLMVMFSNTAFNNQLSDDDGKYIFTNIKTGSVYGGGGVLGIQNQFRNRIFFDFGISLLATNKNTQIQSLTTKYGRNISLNPYLKIGFVK